MPATLDLAVITQVPPIAGWAGVAFLVAWLMRQTALRVRGDINEYKGGSAIANALASLQEQVAQLTAAKKQLEGEKAVLIAFGYKVLSHFSGCGHCSKREAARTVLHDEFDEIMRKITS